MTAQVETALRGPEAYALAHRVIDSMQQASVWPTPLNYELWLHYVSDPDSPLSREMQRLLAGDTPFTEATAEMLAAEFLPRGRLSEEIRDVGAVLNRELAAVAEAIDNARQTQAAYGETLTSASEKMQGAEGTTDLSAIVSTLSSATRRVQHHTSTLEKRLESSNREVLRLREHLEQVRRDAMTDALTNLANRKTFDEQLARLCEEAETDGKGLTLALVDIDHFKRFNDTWGHQTGDQVLRYVASVLGRIARDPRVAARYGGEEFAVIFPGETRGTVEAALNAIREEIASRSLRRRSTNDDLGAVTISVGFAERHVGETALSVLERADAALYVSKRSGRNCVTDAESMAQAAA
ncbi:GGDEF domain-containing protein [Brevundimonas faecalis]|uniref:diguanylate cyclase n=1 Tax=Brevundimonas faecalis TaxID=947378 RepID=A0ABV2RDQ4_9CAUL